MLSCQRCKQTSHGPQAFLLTCRTCNKTWHHRCHMPPVDDDDLIQRLRATNAGDVDNGLAGWMCRRCKRATSMSSRVSSESRDDRKSVVPSYGAESTAVASTADYHIRQEQASVSTEVDVRPPSENVEARPAGEVVTEPQAVNEDAEIDDDPEDLYGPPVPRRVVRIYSPFAEELRARSRRPATVDKAPLAPDWILARHAHDRLWKEIRPAVQGRKRRKPTARNLGDIGLNVDELVGYLVREYKT